MQNIKFSSQIQHHVPQIRLGCLMAEVKVEASSPAFWESVELELEALRTQLTTDQIKQISTVAATRNAYKNLGKDPSRYRPSAEALLRRVVSGKALYQVSNLVDLINRMSIRTGFSIGGYDYDKIVGEIEMSVGRADDDYQAIGRGKLNIEHLPCLRDVMAAFGSPTSDSLRTSIQENTQTCLWVFFDFESDPKLNQALEDASLLLQQFASAKNIQTKIIQA